MSPLASAFVSHSVHGAFAAVQEAAWQALNPKPMGGRAARRSRGCTVATVRVTGSFGVEPFSDQALKMEARGNRMAASPLTARRAYPMEIDSLSRGAYTLHG